MTDVNEILKATNDGLDVFEHYFGIEITGKLFCNTFRSDTRPSCKLSYRHGRYILHDFGSSEWNGDCFTFVGKIINKNCSTQFRDIVNTITRDLGIDGPTSNPVSLRRTAQPSRQIQESYTFSARCRPYTDTELSYWQRYGITEAILKRYSVYSIQDCHFVKGDKDFTICSSKQRPVFGYFFNEGKGIKLYRPKDSVRFLYAGAQPRPYVFGYTQLPPDGEDVFITGGEKDVLSLSSHGFSAICLNSETSSIPENLIEDLQQRFRCVIILYDTDKTGITESESRLHALHAQGYKNIYRVVLPLSGTKSEKDISDYFSLGHTASDLSSYVKFAKTNPI